MIAPEPILRAGLDTVSWACIYARNQSLRDDCSIKELNAIMDSIHEIPRMLMSWSEDRLSEVRLHLGYSPCDRFPDAPNLVTYFDTKLRDYQTYQARGHQQ